MFKALTLQTLRALLPVLHCVLLCCSRDSSQVKRSSPCLQSCCWQRALSHVPDSCHAWSGQQRLRWAGGGSLWGEDAGTGHLAGLLAAGPACADAYRGLSDCVLKLGDSMATYEEEEGIELQGLHRVCRYWDEFHTCALTVLWECQKEAAAVWEMLRRESRKTKFQGSLFDLCSPSMAQSFAWSHVPNISILSIPLIVTWLNL
ncbi:neuritin-like isoform X1 [Catharus ustulatus]|uniref:neuritin-like isoform X1 n=1 Tax=Catharus ustulatus TaxID=91951 RepID=UPI001409E3AD|nr:neuritin-like isoform X1 [Catharus ustulatus]XP_042635733.1 neuritin-like isoform X1 [Catharus ustulatus]